MRLDLVAANRSVDSECAAFDLEEPNELRDFVVEPLDCLKTQENLLNPVFGPLKL